MGKKETRSPGLFDPAPAAPVAAPANLPDDWKEALAAEFSKPYFAQLRDFVAAERKAHQVLPASDDVLNAFRFTPFNEVRVLLLGQDPYPTPGNAHGLSFSVRPGVRLPGSLRNIFQELHDDLGCTIPREGSLIPWAKKGVMLLNAVLTVRANAPNSHQGRGWEQFTDAVIRALNVREQPAVFLLWGSYAQKKAALIDGGRHAVIKSTHPSPLSANNGFFGSKPFSKVNAALQRFGVPEIDWQLPDLERI